MKGRREGGGRGASGRTMDQADTRMAVEERMGFPGKARHHDGMGAAEKRGNGQAQGNIRNMLQRLV